VRFVLDECVDARLRSVIVTAGHECWTVVDAGLSSEDDDEVSVYAADHNAVLVTDDRELIRRRKTLLFGKTVELRGTKRAALENLPNHIDHCVELLESGNELIVAVSAVGAWIIAPAWLATPAPQSGT